MKKIILFILVLFAFFGCKNEDALEEEIAKIDTNFTVERFDLAFADPYSVDLCFPYSLCPDPGSCPGLFDLGSFAVLLFLSALFQAARRR